ncbi:MAG: tRNA (guanosine(37)-N1)-methyltransferase TrmD [Planctomycetota bacterium]
MRFDILTLFPDMMAAVLDTSMLKIARDKGCAEYRIHDIRDFTKGVHRKADDRPFGGGPGMVLKPEPIFECLESFLSPEELNSIPLLAMSPQGERYNQTMAKDLSKEIRIVILCGHYEGFDQRIFDGLPLKEVSIGDYVLTQGELPALVLIDSLVRLRPGVLGDAESAARESFENGLLDHPHYTRPVEFRGMTVPEVLRSGNHAKIEAWRLEQARLCTQERRPDLLEPPPES